MVVDALCFTDRYAAVEDLEAPLEIVCKFFTECWLTFWAEIMDLPSFWDPLSSLIILLLALLCLCLKNCFFLSDLPIFDPPFWAFGWSRLKPA